MSLRTLIIAGLAIAAAVTGLVYAAMQLDPPPREERAIRSAPPNAHVDVPEDTPAPTPEPPASPGERRPPRLPEAQVDPAAPFSDEPRNDDWAPAKEAVIGAKVDTLLGEVRGGDTDVNAVDVTAIECRSRRCRLTIAGADSARVQALVEALQDERGFYGDAEQIMLGGMSEKNGRRQLEATLVYPAE